jgi:hypothetical protein
MSRRMAAVMETPEKSLRSSPRTSVMLRALLHAAGARDPTEHRVVNMSATGLCVAQGRKLKPGTIVVVTLGMLEYIPADVLWAESGLAGLQFHEPIDVQAARTRPKGGARYSAPAAGWIAEIRSPYHR